MTIDKTRETPMADPYTPLPYPDEMSQELRDILGLMIFETEPLAQTFRAAGAQIPRKAEAEQAYVMHWLIKLVLTHGRHWRIHAADQVQQAGDRIAEVRAARANDA